VEANPSPQKLTNHTGSQAPCPTCDVCGGFRPGQQPEGFDVPLPGPVAQSFRWSMCCSRFRGTWILISKSKAHAHVCTSFIASRLGGCGHGAVAGSWPEPWRMDDKGMTGLQYPRGACCRPCLWQAADPSRSRDDWPKWDLYRNFVSSGIKRRCSVKTCPERDIHCKAIQFYLETGQLARPNPKRAKAAM
jgi:hypothetical protein